MSEFEKTLSRVLDPEGLYWRYPGDEVDDAAFSRTVEVRLDIPSSRALEAKSQMGRLGWDHAASDRNGEIEMLFFRREQDMSDQSKTEMLRSALQTAFLFEGRLWSWINVDEDQA